MAALLKPGQSGTARFNDGPTDDPGMSLAAMKAAASPQPIGETGWATIQVLDDAAAAYRLERLAPGKLALQRCGLATPTGDAGDEVAKLKSINAANARFWQRPARPAR